MLKWLLRLFQGKQNSTPAPIIEPEAQKQNPVPDQPVSAAPTAPPLAEVESMNLTSMDQAQEYLERLRLKINALAERFATGNLNRTQFQELYVYYQREMQTIESILADDPISDEWKNAVTEGQSILIRHRNKAQVLGFSLYNNESGMPIKSIGEFGIDPALYVPMHSSYHSATQEIFGAQVRSTQIEGGQWLCFVPGKLTTTMALFNLEPSVLQMKKLEDLQQLFENANQSRLNDPMIDPENLVCPHEFFIGHSL
ncbi:MAG: hypothetical protein M1281_00500 [Chloroflexi bacterium]|nr:hypothetical protein [Chloroflexota bacterium]